MSKIRKILKALDKDTTREAFKSFDVEVEKLKGSLKQEINAVTISDVKDELRKFKKNVNLSGLISAVEGIEKAQKDDVRELKGMLAEKITEMSKQLKSKNSVENIRGLEEEISDLRSGIRSVTISNQENLTTVNKIVTTLQGFSSSVQNVEERLNTRITEVLESVPSSEQLKTDIEEKVSVLQKDLFTKINFAGGNANRNISVGGNSSVLSKYTDLNIKPGSNITLSYSNNDTTKNLDLTIASSGGGGSTRSIDTTTVSSTVGGVASTDYVVLANGGVQITLPTAVSNTNVYIIKNIGTSSVLVSTDGSETIDTNSEIIMPVQFTAIDLISDNSNWQIT